MNKPCLFYSLVLMVWVAGGHFLSAAPENEDSQRLPSGPIKPGDFAAWRIDYVYPDDKKQPSTAKASVPLEPPAQPKNSFVVRPPRQIQITWAKPLWHAAIVDIAGNHLEEWSNGEMRLYWGEGFAPLFAPSQGNFSRLLPDFTKGFPETEWISQTTFSGNQSVGGRQCLLFVKDNMQLWVDGETHYPVQWQKGGVTCTYLPLPSPSGPLEVPPAVARVFAAQKENDELVRKVQRRMSVVP